MNVSILFMFHEVGSRSDLCSAPHTLISIGQNILHSQAQNQESGQYTVWGQITQNTKRNAEPYHREGGKHGKQ